MRRPSSRTTVSNRTIARRRDEKLPPIIAPHARGPRRLFEGVDVTLDAGALGKHHAVVRVHILGHRAHNRLTDALHDEAPFQHDAQ